MTPAQQLGKDIFYEIYIEIGASCPNPGKITLRIAEKVIDRLNKTTAFKNEAKEFIRTI